MRTLAAQSGSGTLGRVTSTVAPTMPLPSRAVMSTRKATTAAPTTRKAGSGFGVAGSRRSLTTRTQTPTTRSRSTGLVVRDAAVASPSPHSHQAAGCWRRGRSRCTLVRSGSGALAVARARARQQVAEQGEQDEGRDDVCRYGPPGPGRRRGGGHVGGPGGRRGGGSGRCRDADRLVGGLGLGADLLDGAGAAGCRVPRDPADQALLGAHVAGSR